MSRKDPLSGWVAIIRLKGLLLCVLSFVFKLAFTQKDGPELLQDILGLERIGATVDQVLGLVWAARLVFLGILASLGVVVAEERQWRLQDKQLKRGREGANSEWLR